MKVSVQSVNRTMNLLAETMQENAILADDSAVVAFGLMFALNALKLNQDPRALLESVLENMHREIRERPEALQTVRIRKPM